MISDPEQFIPAEDRIVVMVHARVLPKNSSAWQDIRLADVYVFQEGRVAKMRAFAKREDALRWAGISNLCKREQLFAKSRHALVTPGTVMVPE